MTIKRFLFHLLLMAIVLALAVLITLFWLRTYTNHGQKLEMPDYVGINYDTAFEDAEDKSFKMVIKDSLHRVDVKGGEILNQLPVAYSKVKEDRTIYVTVAKYNADLIKLEDLPALYGKDYVSKKRELELLQIESAIKGYTYDTGEPDHILAVYQDGKKIVGRNNKGTGVTIPKGGKLEFVLSKSRGGMLEIPDLICQQVSGAEFVLSSQDLEIGKITEEGVIDSQGSAYIIAQYPPYSFGGTIEMGSKIDITISNVKPQNCDQR